MTNILDIRRFDADWKTRSPDVIPICQTCVDAIEANLSLFLPNDLTMSPDALTTFRGRQFPTDPQFWVPVMYGGTALREMDASYYWIQFVFSKYKFKFYPMIKDHSVYEIEYVLENTVIKRNKQSIDLHSLPLTIAKSASSRARDLLDFLDMER